MRQRRQVRSLRRGLHDVLGSRAGALWLFSPLEFGALASECGVRSCAKVSAGDVTGDMICTDPFSSKYLLGQSVGAVCMFNSISNWVRNGVWPWCRAPQIHQGWENSFVVKSLCHGPVRTEGSRTCSSTVESDTTWLWCMRNWSNVSSMKPLQWYTMFAYVPLRVCVILLFCNVFHRGLAKNDNWWLTLSIYIYVYIYVLFIFSWIVALCKRV